MYLALTILLKVNDDLRDKNICESIFNFSKLSTYTKTIIPAL